jgi:hypothetical protein
MQHRHAVRMADAPEESSYSAPIVRFPLVLSVRRSEKREGRRPSLALNVLLMLLLVLACVIWEAVSSRNEAAQDLRHSAVTSPRAAAVTLALAQS